MLTVGLNLKGVTKDKILMMEGCLLTLFTAKFPHGSK